MTPNLNIQPDIKVSIKQSFGIDSEMEVEAFSQKSEYVPEIDKNYKFDRDTTLAIISGFAFNKRVFLMAPIHHHFELKGWPEPKIIVRFWIITLVLILIALATLKLR